MDGKADWGPIRLEGGYCASPRVAGTEVPCTMFRGGSHDPPATLGKGTTLPAVERPLCGAPFP
jgi:hypothetical protein